MRSGYSTSCGLSCLSLFVCIFIATSTAFADPIGKTVGWTANPRTVVQGKTSEVILTAPSATCGTAAGQLSDASLDTAANKPTIHVQSGFNVTVGPITHTGTCELTVSLIAASDAKTGPLRLTLTGTGAPAGPQDLGYSTVTVTSALASPIPDGLDPQVDLEFGVLGYQQVYDNYGRRVANDYFAVEITIGNNTGFPLQLSGAGFKIGSEDAPTPTTNRSIVQGSLLYGQDYSARNVIYRTLVWAAIIGAGVNPYFHAANSKANYSAGLALFSGPIVNGFLQQFPDNTVKQLARLGSSEVMADQNVIPNNSQVPFIAFVSRDAVCSPTHSPANPEICGSVKYHFKHMFYDPDKVKAALGDVTIAGKLLPNFSPRIRVTSASSGTPPSSGTADIPAIEGVDTTISLLSTGLTGASLNAPPAGVTATGLASDASFPVSILALSKSTTPLSIVLKRKDGSLVSFPITVQQPVPIVTLPTGTTTLPVNTATPVTIGWQAQGPDLSSATLSMAATDGSLVIVGATPTTITATIKPIKTGTLPVTLGITVNGVALTDLPPLSVTAK